ncbi:ORF17 [White spot syndrome virus]|uniref:ORF17 n=1 Tax=White spot syndrome virus TaxID=342409 RepID=A0A2D3I647_9VIRU|nr:ORF17 [White spot syndrome virus]
MSWSVSPFRQFFVHIDVRLSTHVFPHGHSRPIRLSQAAHGYRFRPNERRKGGGCEGFWFTFKNKSPYKNIGVFLRFC